MVKRKYSPNERKRESKKKKQEHESHIKGELARAVNNEPNKTKIGSRKRKIPCNFLAHDKLNVVARMPE